MPAKFQRDLHSASVSRDSARETYLALLNRYRRLKHAEVVQLGTVSDGSEIRLPLVAVHIRPKTGEARPIRVMLSAGVHGDEPAGVFALIRFMERYLAVFRQIQFVVFPCVNPIGFVNATRYGSTRHDLNRVVEENSLAPEVRMLVRALHAEPSKFDLCLDLHEDATGTTCDFAQHESSPDAFYLYESCRSSKLGVGRAIVSKLEALRFDVCAWHGIYGERAQQGIILPDDSQPRANLLHLERYLTLRHSDTVLTPETPTCWPLASRVRAHMLGLAAAVGEIVRASSC